MVRDAVDGERMDAVPEREKSWVMDRDGVRTRAAVTMAFLVLEMESMASKLCIRVRQRSGRGLINSSSEPPRAESALTPSP
jgi:hypothetical protein